MKGPVPLVVLLLAVAATPAALRGQGTPEAEQKLSFEVASVKPNHSDVAGSTMSAPGNRLTATNVTVLNLLLYAFSDLLSFQIVGAPGWITVDRFDINANAGSEILNGQQKLMLRSLLAERFQFAAHRESRVLPVYSLGLGRTDGTMGPALRRSDIDCSKVPIPAASRPGDLPCSLFGSVRRVRGRSISMDLFVRLLSRLFERAVVNRTGLAGAFNVDLDWSAEQGADTRGPSIFTAVKEQLGLKLEAIRAPIDVLVVDYVEHPTEN
jgi:uncharacterized protein (TIGR03435 family)